VIGLASYCENASAYAFIVLGRGFVPRGRGPCSWFSRRQPSPPSGRRSSCIAYGTRRCFDRAWSDNASGRRVLVRWRAAHRTATTRQCQRPHRAESAAAQRENPRCHEPPDRPRHVSRAVRLTERHGGESCRQPEGRDIWTQADDPPRAGDRSVARAQLQIVRALRLNVRPPLRAPVRARQARVTNPELGLRAFARSRRRPRVAASTSSVLGRKLGGRR
jgi:hypothetical protein